MSDYGWLAQSALMPQKSKKIKVDANSLVDLKVALLQKKGENALSSTGNTSQITQKNKKTQKFENMMDRKNKNIEMRNKKDIQSQINEQKAKSSLVDKSSIYEKLQKKGHNLEKLLVDFEQKKFDEMTQDEKIDFEKERENFYNKKRQELKEREQQILSQQPKVQELNKNYNEEQSERQQWEQDIMKQLEEGVDEDELLNNVNVSRPLVMQSYDRRATKVEKEKLQEVLKQEDQSRQKIDEIRKRKEMIQLQRKQKLENLQRIKQNKLQQNSSSPHEKEENEEQEEEKNKE